MHAQNVNNPATRRRRMKRKPARFIMRIGKPMHYVVKGFGLPHRACGALSGAGTEDRDKVDCFNCRKTIAFKQP